MVGSDRELPLNLPDGRQLEVLADGPADGLPLLFHYGTPCGAVRYGPLVEAAARRELRTIVYSRPGYGTSTAKHGRSIAEADRKSTRLNSSHSQISYAVFCLKKKQTNTTA